MAGQELKLKKEMRKIFSIHISYIYYAKRFTTPIVHYQLGGIQFKGVKIFGRVVGMKTHQNGDFVLTGIYTLSKCNLDCILINFS